MAVMNDITTDMPMPSEVTAKNQQALTAANDANLEQKMADLGLSNDTKRFLRNLRHAEKLLNDAFNTARQGGELEERVSQVYHDLYGAGCARSASR